MNRIRCPRSLPRLARWLAVIVAAPAMTSCGTGSETSDPTTDFVNGSGGSTAASSDAILGSTGGPGATSLGPASTDTGEATPGEDSVTSAIPPGGSTGAPSPTSSAGGDGAGSGGCNASGALESGTFTIDVMGTERTYILDVPADYDAGHAYPLVFVWHPLGGSAMQVVNGNYDRLRPLANGSAIFVAPDGLEGTAAGIDGKGWYNRNGEDMRFLEAMLDQLQDGLCIDEDRIFSTGFSFGGMMSYAIGCEFSHVFRAIAPSSGNMQGSGCNDASDMPIAVLGLHGADDDFVGTDGGRAARDAFVEKNHCTSTTEAVAPSPCVQYQGCDEGYPVLWCEYPGGHTPWAEAPSVIWDFFSGF